MELKPFEHSVQQLKNTRMLTSGRKRQYGVVYLDERDWFLVLSSSQSNFAKVLAPLLAQCWNRLNGFRTTLFCASNIWPTFVQQKLVKCWEVSRSSLQHPTSLDRCNTQLHCHSGFARSTLTSLTGSSLILLRERTFSKEEERGQWELSRMSHRGILGSRGSNLFS